MKPPEFIINMDLTQNNSFKNKATHCNSHTQTASTTCGFLITGTCRECLLTNILSVYYQFTDGRPTASTIKCQTKQCDSAVVHERCCTSGNSMPVIGGVSITHKFYNRCGYSTMLLIMAVQIMAQLHKHIHYK